MEMQPTDNRPLIAVVDDEASICRAFGRLLRSAGFAVVTFTNGADFFEFLESGQVDCVILDLNMPHMTGFEVQSRLRQTGKRIPVVVITGHDTPGTYEQAMENGAVRFLRKPADDQTLVEAVLAGTRAVA